MICLTFTTDREKRRRETVTRVRAGHKPAVPVVQLLPPSDEVVISNIGRG